MAKTLTEAPGGLSNQNLRNALEEVQDNLCDVVLNAAGLVIGLTDDAAVKIANTIYASIAGALVKKTTAEITISGTVAHAKFNVYVLTINSAGTVTATMGTEGATIGAVVFPTVPADEAVIGFIIINPTGSGDFVGGTTVLSAGTVTPNTVYVDTPYPFNLNTLAL